MRFVHSSQQGDVGIVVAAGELVAPVDPSLHGAAFPILPHQTRDLGATQPRHLPQIPADQTLAQPAKAPVLLLNQRSTHPRVHPASVHRLKMQLIARPQKRLDLFQA
jgi:hypothetical protein